MLIETRSRLLPSFQQYGEAERRRWQRCQRGAHDMLATATPRRGGLSLGPHAGGVPVVWLEPAAWGLHYRLLAASRTGALAGSAPAHRGDLGAGRHRGERL